MDYQTTFSEAIAKLAEAQKCQNKIVDCNHELQQVNVAITEVCNIFNVYKTKTYLNYRYTTLTNEIKNYIRERDEALNESLNKALDLADDETDCGTFCANSLGGQAMEAILFYVIQHNIYWRYSIEVNAKLAKIIDKGVNAFNQFINQQTYFSNRISHY